MAGWCLSAVAPRGVSGLSQLSRRSDRVASFSLRENQKTGRFSGAHRLHHRWEYLRFFKGAEVFRLPECVIFRVPSETPHFRLGITIKTRASSVERNRVKRAVRESFRQLNRDLGAYNYNVVIPQGKKLSFPYPEKLKNRLITEFRNALSHR